MRALVDGGIWAKLDAFQLYAVHTNDAGCALKDWVSLTRTITITNSPSFTAYQGFAGIIANTTRINTGWNPSAGVNFTQNNNSFGLYNRKARNASNTRAHGIQTVSGMLGVYLRSGRNYFVSHNNSLTGVS